MTDHRDLDRLLGGAREALEGQAREEGARPDFADVMRRMTVEDGGVAPDRATTPDNVTPLRPPITPDAHGEAALDAFLVGPRAALEDMVSERLARGIPPMREPQRPRTGLSTGIAAAAAVLLIVGAGVWGVSAMRGEGPLRSQAQMVEEKEPAPGRTVHPTSVRERPTYRAVQHEEAAPPPETDGANEAGPAARLPPPDESEESRPQTEEARSSQRPSDDRGTRLRELDDRARQAWREGRLDEARGLFEEIVRIGGRHRLAELAFAELFTMAHGDSPAARSRLWRKYLKRFPRGRFTDDARAGLCRAMGGDRGADCWRDYLKLEPDGTHRAEAERAVSRDNPG